MKLNKIFIGLLGLILALFGSGTSAFSYEGKWANTEGFVALMSIERVGSKYRVQRDKWKAVDTSVVDGSLTNGDGSYRVIRTPNGKIVGIGLTREGPIEMGRVTEGQYQNLLKKINAQ